ncbi:esterase/lipase family protein [Priestia taiwanensis]|uniref:triacylglycerol lipase n=1 Tax=Priestia taiwanensis TaxID=1347902 RepID=A0A917AXV6_9BACI|nr:lipase [Priestia taiwanensis]MBM7364704.1 triacylglycerol lipase [Priestia taiwanensis]GGE79000.1 lipase [Priestia taiwanensis]
MKKLVGGFAFFFLCIQFMLLEKVKVYANGKQNDYPIVLVHGLGGWGKDEMLGYKYWGGFLDIERDLNKRGYQTFTATVGPVSSNWDRAIELYYYIKGGTVDYGAAHAKEHGHDRYGATYEGIYPEWNEQNKLHFIGHSMGGQTSRALTELLKNGSEKERAYAKQHPNEKISPLFEGGKDYVHSITSLATPHNGSTFANNADQSLTFIKNFLLHTASAASNANVKNPVYDFKLDHWGIEQREGENFKEYMDRLLASPIWESKDISLYDLTTYGADELNRWVSTHPDVYHFSYTGDATYRVPVSGTFLPLPSMNPLLYVSGTYIGSYNAGALDHRWWENDGVVSVVSSQYPFGHKQEPYDGQVEAGEWNYFPTQERWDHLDFVGMNPSDTFGFSDIYGFYHTIAKKLYELPRG